MKTQIFELIYINMIKNTGNYGWIMLRKDWNKWIFKDWEIFNTILALTDHLMTFILNIIQILQIQIV